jgi:hypothetical protein
MGRSAHACAVTWVLLRNPLSKSLCNTPFSPLPHPTPPHHTHTHTRIHKQPPPPLRRGAAAAAAAAAARARAILSQQQWCMRPSPSSSSTTRAIWTRGALVFAGIVPCYNSVVCVAWCLSGRAWYHLYPGVCVMAGYYVCVWWGGGGRSLVTFTDTHRALTFSPLLLHVLDHTGSTGSLTDTAFFTSPHLTSPHLT